MKLRQQGGNEFRVRVVYFVSRIILKSFSHFLSLTLMPSPPPISQSSEFLTLLPALPSPRKGCLGRNNGFQPLFYFERVERIDHSFVCLPSGQHSAPFTFHSPLCLYLNLYTHTHVFPLYHLEVKGYHTIKHKPQNTSPCVFYFKGISLI